jgi:SAM-dependent methyltransferase
MTLAVAPLTWPFWAPTPLEEIEHALDIAGVGPGCRLLDLGCGDGRVLEAAVRRGAIATGYEIDPRRLDACRRRIAALNGAATVIEADFNQAPLRTDVVFAFLSPASLYGLRARLGALAPGTRIVTYAYGVVGWRPALMDQRWFLYRLPAIAAQDPLLSGWRHAGLVMAQPSAQTVLVGTMYGARPGKLAVEVSPWLQGRIEVHSGAAECGLPDNVPLDIKFCSAPGEEVVTGTLKLQGRELFICLVSGAQERLCRRLDPEGVLAVQAQAREAQAGRLPIARLLEALRPAGVIPTPASRSE